ncbi:MAG: hypothetical protein KVP17_001944 [Porospora cf. gigantea B]|uniref:uncharacterized protein n=1 Tax=Porospora cf. gigantea B TaxID=2853592 RepID=UPI003571A310|nr:MAG: hypothetical protein KVP17_001944 [Porospora cf. gigantea B]
MSEGRIFLLCLELDWVSWPALAELGWEVPPPAMVDSQPVVELSPAMVDLQPLVELSPAMVDLQPVVLPTERTLTEQSAVGHAHEPEV